MDKKFVILYVLDGIPNVVTDGDNGYPYVFKSLIEASNWLMDREQSIRLLSACESVLVIDCMSGDVESF